MLGGLLLMPLGLGMQPFMFDANALFSLIGHLLYGAILGVVAVGILSRRR